jgi:hypothetical protein
MNVQREGVVRVARTTHIEGRGYVAIDEQLAVATLSEPSLASRVDPPAPPAAEEEPRQVEQAEPAEEPRLAIAASAPEPEDEPEEEDEPERRPRTRREVLDEVERATSAELEPLADDADRELEQGLAKKVANAKHKALRSPASTPVERLEAMLAQVVDLVAQRNQARRGRLAA